MQQSPPHKPSHAQCKTPYLVQTTTDKIPKWVLSLALLILVWNPFFELSLPRLIDVMIWCTRITAKSCQTLLFVRPKPTTRPSITEYKDNKLMAINSCLEMLKTEWPLFTVYILGQWDLYYFSVLLYLILSSLNWADIKFMVPCCSFYILLKHIRWNWNWMTKNRASSNFTSQGCLKLFRC